ncbi:MAG: hypothetical protein IKO99_00450 [Bacteroidales bacterium]|nr:hypothetical protein [Bacteroidales bacterium]
MKKTSIILLIIFFILGCRETSEIHQQLVKADSLLYKNFVDSANNVLKEIEPKTQEDSAYFFVLKAETTYREGKNPDFNEINFSIKYYEKHSNNRNLANAYYYKACAFIIRDTLPNKIFTFLKKAEQVAEKTSDNSLKGKICSALAYTNAIFGELETALYYANKDYLYAKRLNYRRDIAYALIRISAIYNELGKIDSSEYYILQCKTLINEVNNNDKAFIYNLLGECFLCENTEAAKNYFITALKYAKIPMAYRNLSKIYYAKNDIQNWKIYCDSASVNVGYKDKIDILSDIAQTYYDDNNFAAYKQTTDKIIKTMNDWCNNEKENYSLEIQHKFDYEKQKNDYQRKILVYIVVLIVLIILVFNGIIIYKRRMQTKLETITELNGLKLSILEKGRIIYDKINNCQPISDDKNDWINCVYYFYIKNSNADKILGIYNDLTIADQIFIIADDFLKKADEDIANIFDIETVTVRTRRSKLKKKLK